MSFDSIQIPFNKSHLEQLKNAVQSNNPVNIKLSAQQLKKLDGLIPFLVTKTQANRIMKSKMNGKGMTLRVSKRQLMANKKNGGFLPFLIPVATAVLSSVASYGATKAIEGIEGAVSKNKQKKAEKKAMQEAEKARIRASNAKLLKENPNLISDFQKEFISKNPFLKNLPLTQKGGCNSCQYCNGSGLQPFGTGLKPFGTGLSPIGTGLKPFGTGLKPFGTGLKPFGTGLSPISDSKNFLKVPLFTPNQGSGLFPLGVKPNKKQ